MGDLVISIHISRHWRESKRQRLIRTTPRLNLLIDDPMLQPQVQTQTFDVFPVSARKMDPNMSSVWSRKGQGAYRLQELEVGEDPLVSSSVLLESSLEIGKEPRVAQGLLLGRSHRQCERVRLQVELDIRAGSATSRPEGGLLGVLSLHRDRLEACRPALAVSAIVRCALAREPEGAHGGADVVDDVGGCCWGAAEVPHAVDSSCSCTVSACGSRHASTSQVWTEGGCECCSSLGSCSLSSRGLDSP